MRVEAWACLEFEDPVLYRHIMNLGYSNIVRNTPDFFNMFDQISRIYILCSAVIL